MQTLKALRPHAASLRIRSPVRRLRWFPLLRRLRYPAGTATVLWLRGNHRGNNGAALSGKRRGRPLQSGRPRRVQRAPTRVALSLRNSEGRALCQAVLPGRGVEPCRPWVRVVRASVNPSPHPIPSPKPVTESPK